LNEEGQQSRSKMRPSSIGPNPGEHDIEELCGNDSPDPVVVIEEPKESSLGRPKNRGSKPKLFKGKAPTKI